MMEAGQHDHQENTDGSKGGYNSSNGGRQSSTRWTPTPDQIRILKDLYYNRGVRSPNGEQIQSISANLRQYGKIEGKNVFYWFQNHKARERQKKRFTNTTAAASAAAANNPPSNWISTHKPNNYIYSNITPGFFPASTSSPSGIAVAQMGSYAYGSIATDKSFRDCSGSKNQNNYGAWADPYSSCYSFFDMQKSMNETLEIGEHEEEEEDEDEDDEKKGQDLATLPLFPTEKEEINGYCNNNNKHNYSYTWYDDHHSNSHLELSLNSYTAQPPHHFH